MNDTIYSAFCQAATLYPDNAFIHIPRQATQGYADGPVDYTYAAALRQTEELKNAYAEAGYSNGHRVAVMMDNRAEFFMQLFALNALGISVVPVNSAFQPEEMGYVISHSDCCLLVSLPEYLPAAATALARHENNIAVIASDNPGALQGALQQVKPAAAATVSTAGNEAAVLYTSGTTGKPKACMLSNDYFISMGDWYCNVGGYCQLEPGRERLLTPLPLTHMNALCCSSMAMIMSGGCLIQLDRFHASNWWETVKESRASCLHYLGVLPAILLALPETADDNLSEQIKFGFGAGADPKHQATFEQRFGFPLIEAWAMTESGVNVCISAHEEPRHIGNRCIGKPLNDIEYRLVDEAGNEVPAGAAGELLIRMAGENPKSGFFSGYYKDAAATAAAWEGGYFHTGDVVRCDTEGFFYFVDRRKNIIRRSGENIAAIEVENILFQHPAIASCVVSPVYDELRGEEVGACIVIHPGLGCDETLAKEIFAFCAAKLIYYKVPAYYFFVDQLPMTESQKIQRGEIKKLVGQLVENKQAIDLRPLKRQTK